MLKNFIRQRDESRMPPTAADGRRLLAEQDLARGTLAAAVAALVAMALWVWAGLLFDRYFPWVSMLQGMLIGLAMRRYGRGLGLAYAAVAAAITAVAAAVGSFLNALFLTGREFGMNALGLVDEISLYTLRTFFTREFGVVGLIYMLFAAILAAFYSNRRLQRGEAAALRRARQA